MSTATLTVLAVRGVAPFVQRFCTFVTVELELTTAQRIAAVAELLGTGISEQQAYEGVRAAFPAWFEQPQPEVRDSTWGEFEAEAAR